MVLTSYIDMCGPNGYRFSTKIDLKNREYFMGLT